MVPIDYFDLAEAQNPRGTAIVDGDVRLTYEDVGAYSRRIAAGISVWPGRTPIPVVIYSPNDYRILLVMLGVMRAGAVIVPVHAGNPVGTTVACLRQVSPRLAFFHSSLRAQVEVLRERLPTIEQWVCLDAQLEGYDTFDAFMQVVTVAQPEWIEAAANRDRPVYYWSTSGTTGDPKVVIDDVGTFDGAVTLVRHRQIARSERHVTLAVAPLSHGAGPHCFAFLTLGGTVVIARHFDPHEVLSTIERYGVTDMWLPPTALYLLLDSPEIRRCDLSSIRHIQLGTAAVSPHKLREAVDVFGPCLSQTYGQIETGFVTAMDPVATAAAAHDDSGRLLQSAGRTLSVNRVAIMNEAGEMLPPGVPGEVVVRGRCVKRYFDDETTRYARRFGWHHTGDVGYLDDAGYLFIVGRIKDVINMAGLKLPAADLEAAILELPEVLECAVVAMPHPVRGEVPQAIVVVKQGGRLYPAAVVEHCRQRFGAARSVSAVSCWPVLPKSPAGKVDKQRIRQMLTTGDCCVSHPS
jgi:acyl-coenzyme A synthetase/AMP-(fatty) acid ligase